MNYFWALTWQGKLPDLETVLIDPKRPRGSGAQSGKQIATALHALAGIYGLTVTKEPRPRVH